MPEVPGCWTNAPKNSLPFLICSVFEFHVVWQSGGTLFIASSSLQKQLLRERSAHRVVPSQADSSLREFMSLQNSVWFCKISK